MTWVRQLEQLTDVLSDRLNPLLVKEVRQALKGKLFLVTFGLLLLGAWVVSVLGVTSAGDAIDLQSSPWLLSAYVIVLEIAVLVFVPLLAFRSMQAETEVNTWELICITTLSPRRLVAGKLSCAVVQSLLLSSVLAPCIAFCSLLPGFDWIVTAIVLGATMILSLLNSIFSVMLSSLTTNRNWQNFTTLMLLVLLAGETWFVCAVTNSLITGQDITGLFLPSRRGTFSGTLYITLVTFPRLNPWIVVGTLTVMSVAYFFLFFEIAVSQVTFEADSRSGRIRLTCSLLYALQWVLLVACDPPSYGDNPALDVFIVHWAVFGMSACLEPETISTRIRRRLSGWSRLRSPFLPGGSRALVFLLLHLGATPLIATILPGWFPGFQSGQQVAMWSMYLLVYSTFAVAICRSILAVTPTFRRANLRLGVVIAVALSMLPSLILTWTFHIPYASLHVFFLTIFNPFAYSAISRESWALVTPIILVALIGVHLNWEIIKRSVLDVSPVTS